MKAIIQIVLAAFLRRPQTTDAIVGALTKTVDKLEKHADKHGAKAEDVLTKAADLVAVATELKEDAEKARVIAKNMGALFK